MPERANLVARIRGRGDGPSLALLSHTDVVLADPREWTREPFGGELVDGEVWGRGALDMKGEVAASAVTLATLAREGWRGSGDLIFIAAADEEVGDGFGLEWLVEAHPDDVRADFSVNEGAGDRVELGGKVLYLCATAEKMSAPFLLRVHGRSGHASVPSIADNALVKAAQHVTRLGEFTAEPVVIPEVAGLLAALLGYGPRCGGRARRGARGCPARRRADRAVARHDRLADEGACLGQAQRDPRALRDHDRRAPAAGADARPMPRRRCANGSARATTSS